VIGADRTTWVRDCLDALSALEARGIDQPAAVQDAVATLRRVESAQPAENDTQAIRKAILAGADQDELDGLLLADLGAQRMKSEWIAARTDAAGAVLAAIRASSDKILPILRGQAEQAIDKLRDIAAIGPSQDLHKLIRAGRTDDARLLADAQTIAAELDAAYLFRDRYLTRGGPAGMAVNGIDCSRWQDPVEAARLARGPSAAESYVSGLRSHLELWFPTPAEAKAAAQALADAAAAAAEAKRKREHGVGSFVAFN